LISATGKPSRCGSIISIYRLLPETPTARWQVIRRKTTKMNKNMKKRNYISVTRSLAAGLLLLSTLCFYSCEIDSAAEPDGIVSGVLRDAIALANGEDPTFWSEQPNGYQISCHEYNWQGSETKENFTFWGKADGTFYNCRIFATDYDIRPDDGAFQSIENQRVKVASKGETRLTFDVIPYCSFHDVSIEKDPNTQGTLIVRFKVTTNPIADDPETEADESKPATIRNWRFFATSRTPYVGNNVYDTDVSTNSDQALTEAQLGTEIVRVFTGFKPGVKYWVRIAARCNESSSGRYNMTKIYEITF
jgi:hypothetical protein